MRADRALIPLRVSDLTLSRNSDRSASMSASMEAESPRGPRFSRPFFMSEGQRVSKSEFVGGALATPDNWLQAVLEYEHPSNASRYLINIGAHFSESDVVGRVMTLSETSGIAIDLTDRMTWIRCGRKSVQAHWHAHATQCE